ncbi:MAG: exopolysaccharide biosynthesis polyprenyl glycosylphosphotransferase [Bacteroidales bacterium]|nr:exopolysaccharide biosynthesis polyprenyl glycosylphosphotransferase [Bacteroidales bacterium]
MGRRSLNKSWYRFLSSTFLTFLMMGCFAYVWYTEFNNMLDKEFLLKGNYLVIAVYGIITTYFISFFGGFKIGVSKKTNVIISQVIGLILSNSINFVITVLTIGYLHFVPRIVVCYFILFVVEVIVIVLFSYFFMTLFYKIFPPYKVLNIKGEYDNDLAMKFNKRNDKYNVVGEISYDADIEEISKMVDDYDAVLLNDIPSERRNIIMKLCFAKGRRVYITPKISDIIVRGAETLAVFDTPLLFSHNNTLTFTEKGIKRLFDIFLSTFGLIVLSPLMILVSLAIFLYDRGPVFYRQTRYTIDGKTFKILKFRSMIPNAEKDGVARLAADKDDRITPVGRFIRACRLDELPQFFNILAGDMSFVGPRPERPEIADEYVKELPEFEFRLKVKAGLTGYAQIYGKYNTTSYDKLKLDMIYVENCSLLMDLKLLLLTLKVIFMKESTEGVEEGQITAKNNN